ncbi:hypothetical protein P3X46_028802 [Hevea brasiliensis]|uniref:Uncharacterized protein n=2 Tax=Hevea brasiliensis TaxID=3981 RepID=A0ABQ9KTB3_HEVBR|nr:putative F-box/kelch-repeat protein At3g17280 [Hevea brasiliensis]KAF2311783.1 hypothetical protein GH714_026688 [Hevea brasiliensis]KAJ9146553.1 hypothetical protein P3X46_028802 [Hevea brasiliensis]
MKSKRRSTESMANNSTASPTLRSHDIIKDIISRLPVKSIKRFESVCKAWYFLFNSTEFISIHLGRSSDHPSLLIRRFHNPTGSNFSLSLIDNRTSTPREMRIPFLGSLIRYPKIIASCNGIICFDISPCYASAFVLWNISTRRFRGLPRPRINDAHKPIWMVATGFGYNRQSSDFKLVRIVNFQCKEDESPVVRAEVYLWSTSSWRVLDGRMIEERIGFCVIPEGQQAVTVDESMHWVANGVGKLANHKFIVSFNMGNEEFRRVQLLDFIPSGICAKFVRFNESLALALYPAMPVYPGYGRPINRIELWTLDKDYPTDGDCKYWTKLHAMDLNSSGLGTPIGVYNDSELLVKRVEVHCVTLSFFDPYNKSIKTLPICSSDYTCEFYSYVDSLVPVVNAEELEVEEAQKSEIC